MLSEEHHEKKDISPRDPASRDPETTDSSGNLPVKGYSRNIMS